MKPQNDGAHAADDDAWGHWNQNQKGKKEERKEDEQKNPENTQGWGENSQGSNQGQRPQVERRPGDWDCECGYMNFAKNSVCRVLNDPKWHPKGAGAGTNKKSYQGGNWEQKNYKTQGGAYGGEASGGDAGAGEGSKGAA